MEGVGFRVQGWVSGICVRRVQALKFKMLA